MFCAVMSLDMPGLYEPSHSPVDVNRGRQSEVRDEVEQQLLNLKRRPLLYHIY